MEEEIISNCDRCGKFIPKGSAYVCVTRNIEQVEHSIIDSEDQVVVIQSDVLIALCGSCGNNFDTETLVTLINLTQNGKTRN